jgi:hypothetical protein
VGRKIDERLRLILSDLRKKGSSEVADWLMQHYPAGSLGSGEAIILLAHLSLKRADQARLAEHYLSRLPFASARPYETFASFMQVRQLVQIMRKYVPDDQQGKQLLEYYAAPVLNRAAKNAEDHEAVQRFLAELKTTQQHPQLKRIL